MEWPLKLKSNRLLNITVIIFTLGEADSKEKTDEELGKPVLQLTKKQQELFPFLSNLRTTALPGRNTALEDHKRN